MPQHHCPVKNPIPLIYRGSLLEQVEEDPRGKLADLEVVVVVVLVAVVVRGSCYNYYTRHRVSTSTYSLTFRVRVILDSNATCAPIANPPNSAQLGGSLYHSPSYIRVRAVVWAYSHGRTDRQTDRQTQTHSNAGDHNTLRVVYDSREM